MYPFSYVIIIRCIVIFLICGIVYPSSLSRIILALCPDSLSSSVRCKIFFSSVVSILMRNVSLTVLLKIGKLKILRYLNTHYQFYRKIYHAFYRTVNFVFLQLLSAINMYKEKVLTRSLSGQSNCLLFLCLLLLLPLQKSYRYIH